ncbi:MAG: hypothetical protein NVS4B6_09170 [Mycobacterium sp.]
MNTTDNRESTHRLGSLKKLATAAVLAGGVGMAAIGMGAGIANTDPEITCPTGVVAGRPSTATLVGWQLGTVLVYLDSFPVNGSHNPVIANVPVDTTLAGNQYFYVPVPALAAGDHELFAVDDRSAPLAPFAWKCFFHVQ